MLASYVVITASMKNSRNQKAILSRVYRGDRSTAMTALELILVPVSGGRWSPRYLAASLCDYHNFYLLYSTTAIQTGYHEKCQAKLCCVCKQGDEVCPDSAGFGAQSSLSSKDFLHIPHVHPLLTAFKAESKMTIYNETARWEV